jgi:hypothetical protein
MVENAKTNILPMFVVRDGKSVPMHASGGSRRDGYSDLNRNI